jgi:HEAT repeat protein
MATGLLIATEKAPGTTVLIPFDDQPEWQLWNVHKETSVGYLSFRSFLEHEVNSRLPLTDMRTILDIIGRAREGGEAEAYPLMRVTNPDALPLLLDLLNDARLAGIAARGLGSIGTDEAVAALGRLPDDEVVRTALVTAGTHAARDALADRGDYLKLYELQDPRAFRIAEQVIRGERSRPPWAPTGAVTILGLSGDTGYVPLLRGLLDDSDVQMRYSAAYALARLGDRQGEEVIERLIQTPGFPHVSAAKASLERFRQLRNGT